MEDRNTFEKCLALSGTEKEKAFFSNSELREHLDEDDIAYKEVKICARAWNTDADGKVWEPTWNDGSWKHSPWMEVEADEENPAGFGFSFTSYVYGYSGTYVGSRLCFPSSSKAIEFGKTFADQYKRFWLIPKK